MGCQRVKSWCRKSRGGELPQPRKIATIALRIFLWSIVAWSIFSTVRNAADQLQLQQSALRRHAQDLLLQAESETDSSLSQQLRARASLLLEQQNYYWKADWRLLVASGLVYAMGMLPAALYWRTCLSALGQQVGLLQVLWAYFYGNLGKYFPGKAMVVILRLSALPATTVRRVAATVTIFIETLTMMAVGGAVAAACLILLNLDWRLTLLAIGLILLTMIPTCPWFLRRLLHRFQSGVDPATLQDWSSGIDLALILRGWFILAWTWLAFGLSLGLVLQGLPCTELAAVSQWEFWLSALGACAMAVVLGFVSLVPGGAGVREAVLSIILAPVVGPIAAVSCALWLRLTWLATELLMAAFFYWLRFFLPNAVNPPP
jgi:glycosyltransferase 2 family protein